MGLFDRRPPLVNTPFTEALEPHAGTADVDVYDTASQTEYVSSRPDVERVSRLIMPRNIRRTMGTIYIGTNSTTVSVSVAIGIASGRQEFEMISGDFYEIPLVQSANGKTHCYNGEVWMFVSSVGATALIWVCEFSENL